LTVFIKNSIIVAQTTNAGGWHMIGLFNRIGIALITFSVGLALLYGVGYCYYIMGANDLAYFDTVQQNREIDIDKDFAIARSAKENLLAAQQYGFDPGWELQDAIEKYQMLLLARIEIQAQGKLQNTFRFMDKFSKQINVGIDSYNRFRTTANYRRMAGSKPSVKIELRTIPAKSAAKSHKR
jgi:hypothetical protein